MSLQHIIRLEKVSKWFGKLKALDRVSFSVGMGEVVCYLGPNGAGKTTTIKIISGLLYADEGEVMVLGKKLPQEIQEVRPHLGIMSAEKPYCSQYYSVERVLYLYGELYGYSREALQARVEELLDIFGLKYHRRKRIYELSRGLRTRVSLARALIQSPQLLLLDEPTSGIDVQAAVEIRKYILYLAKNYRATIFMATHNMFEAQQMASRVVIINKGRIIANDTIINLQQTIFSVVRLRIVCDRPEETKNVLEKYGECTLDQGALLLSTGKDVNLNEILRNVITVDRIREINTIQPTLEDIVMEVIKNESQ